MNKLRTKVHKLIDPGWEDRRIAQKIKTKKETAAARLSKERNRLGIQRKQSYK